MYNDSEHEVIDLCEGAELHRFLNGGGTPYSAIYFGSSEMYSCEREKENGMLIYFIRQDLRKRADDE